MFKVGSRSGFFVSLDVLKALAFLMSGESKLDKSVQKGRICKTGSFP